MAPSGHLYGCVRGSRRPSGDLTVLCNSWKGSSFWTTSKLDGRVRMSDGNRSNLIAVLSLAVALVSVLSASLLQWQSQKNEREMTIFQTTFLTKQAVYADFITAV